MFYNFLKSRLFSKKSKSDDTPWELLVGTISVCSVVLLLMQFKFSPLNNFLYNTQLKLKANTSLSENILLVGINDKGLETYAKTGLTVKSFSEFLKKISKTKPKSVNLFTNMRFNDSKAFIESISGTIDEKQELAHWLKKLNVNISVNDSLKESVSGPTKLVWPFNLANLTETPIPFENPGQKAFFVKRFFYSINDRLMLIPSLLEKNNENNLDKSKLVTAGITKQGYINFAKLNSFKIHSFFNIINEKESIEKFENKHIFIATTKKLSTYDRIKSPITSSAKNSFPMTTLEMYGNVMSNLILDNSIKKTRQVIPILISFLASSLSLVYIFLFSPSIGFIALICTFFILFALSQFFLSHFLIFIPMAKPFLSLFINYYLLIPYRLIIENKKSWNYKKKNELLLQVEEMKSNFLRMISHDLKTPLARIQGMTDVILRNSMTKLSPLELEAIKNIKISTGELNEFVHSILNVGRVESNEVKLQLSSKDINTLISNQIDKLSYFATEKNIKIQLNLEPMFSLLMDTNLISQVIHNLMVNAIKYSHSNSTISVKSYEKGSYVYVSIQDFGSGIDEDDLDKIFSKFYRTNNAQNSNVKGSGLGLYLARYFIELHNGFIEVESVLNEGTTFVLKIPTDLDPKLGNQIDNNHYDGEVNI